MTNETITALAREYAEEKIDPRGFSKGTYEDLVDENAEYTEDVIRFLLRRYCLVEKSTVENIHKGILVQLNPKNFGYSPYNQGRIDLLKSLFPEIAKEVK